jgi:hypothetical protein
LYKQERAPGTGERREGVARTSELNEFDRLRRGRRRKRLFRRAVAAVFLAAVAVVAVLIASVVYQLDLRSQLENYAASLRRGDGFPVALDGMTIQALLPMGRDVAVLTSSGAYIYNSSGALVNSCLNNYRTPIARTAGGKLLTYDLGGTGLRVDNKAKQLYSADIEGGSILAADIAPTGAIAVARSSPGVTAQVSAYNPRFELMYVWTVTDSYITGVSLSRRGSMMACAGVVMEDQHIVSLLRIHHFDQDQEAARVPLTGEIIASMVWTEEEEIQVVTDKNLYLFSKEGAQLAKAALPSTLLTYENLPGAVYIACGDYRDPAGVTILSYDGGLKQLGSASVDRRLLSLTADSAHLLVLTEGQLYLGDPALRELKRREHQDFYRVCPAGSDLYGITPDGLVRTGL